MIVEGRPYRTIWLNPEDKTEVNAIDQRFLPHKLAIEKIGSHRKMADAIKEMHVRGAGLIGAAAGYGMYLACLEAPSAGTEEFIQDAVRTLLNTRPTAVNLSLAVKRQLDAISNAKTKEEKIDASRITAEAIANEDAEQCRMIGQHGLKLIEKIASQKKEVNIMTHCNAGWLAFVDHGTATAPVYAAHDLGMKLHVWVKETRPRNQGASLTAWELLQHGIPNTIIVDNAAGYLMQAGKVDMVIVGTDRTTLTGDVANKIGTYMLALAAYANKIPFYVAAPSSSIDWNTREGRDIPIEERSESEVREIQGLNDGKITHVLLTPNSSRAKNYGFDITPKELVTGLITERGVCRADEESIAALFPEKSGA